MKKSILTLLCTLMLLLSACAPAPAGSPSPPAESPTPSAKPTARPTPEPTPTPEPEKIYGFSEIQTVYTFYNADERYTPEEVAWILFLNFLNDLRTPSDDRVFTLIDYKNLKFTIWDWKSKMSTPEGDYYTDWYALDENAWFLGSARVDLLYDGAVPPVGTWPEGEYFTDYYIQARRYMVREGKLYTLCSEDMYRELYYKETPSPQE